MKRGETSRRVAIGLLLFGMIGLFLLFFSECLFAYGFTSNSAICGSGYANKKVNAVISLVNTGGMNIFYIVTDGDQITENIYGNVAKKILITGYADGSGNLPYYISSNYNQSYTVSTISCVAVGMDTPEQIAYLFGFTLVQLFFWLLSKAAL